MILLVFLIHEIWDIFCVYIILHRRKIYIQHPFGCIFLRALKWKHKNVRIRSFKIGFIISFRTKTYSKFIIHTLTDCQSCEKCYFLRYIRTHTWLKFIHISLCYVLGERNRITYTHIYAHAILPVEFTEDSV